ncbi:MAG: metallophosphoesterase family protein [Thermodesulfobacteriota bacterium]
MIIIGLTDIHGQLAAVDGMAAVLRKADMVLLAGDITHFGREDAAGQVLFKIRKYASVVLAVCGNCDYAGVEKVLTREKVSCHGVRVLADGVAFVGLGGSLTTPFHTPGEYTEDELAGFLDAAATDLNSELPLVLISHQPPLHTACDRLSDGTHVGSRAVRQFIERYQPLLCLTGHIHEAAGMDRIGRTVIVNPGPIGRGGFMRAEITGRQAAVTLERVSE